MRDFEGKVAVVTGAASGIGRAIADRLARENMKLVLADIDDQALDAAVADLRGRGAEVLGVPTDVSSVASVENLAQETLSRFGAVHLVCSNAGVEGHMDGPIWEATEKDWLWTLGVNLWGAVYCSRVFLPLLIEQGEGHLVITASATGYILPRSMYNLSKHAVVAFAELAYAQLKQQNSPVELSLLCPGAVATNIFRHERPTALRNAPDPVRDQGAAELRRMMFERNQRRGVDPAIAAEALLAGIREDRFYIFTDNEWDALIETRFDHVLSRKNPIQELE
jgi:NAD(P)-dependent dehydrogenase (short-subunit alcohol dehydrogenase family)